MRKFNSSLLLLNVLLAYNCFSQPNLPKYVADSLWAVWSDKTQADTNRLDALYKYTWDGFLFSQPDSAFYYAELEYNYAKTKGLKKQMAAGLIIQGVSSHLQSKYTEAFQYYNHSLKILEDIRDKPGIARCLNNIGVLYSNQGNKAQAIKYYSQCLKINEEFGDKKGIAMTFINLGTIYSDQGNYSKALECFTNGLKKSEEIGYKQGVANSLNNIGVINVNLGNYAQAINYYNQSLKIEEDANDKKGIASSLRNIGVLYSEQGNHAQSINYYTQSLKICEEIDDKHGIIGCLICLGVVYKKQGNYNKASNYYARSLKLSEEIANKQDMVASLINLGSLYFIQENYVLAVKHSSRALLLAQELGAILEVSSAAKSLWEINKKLGRYKEALAMHELYIQMRDSIQSEENQKEVIRQEYQYNYEKKAATDSVSNAKANEIKNAQIAQQKAEIKAKRNQQYALYGGLTLVLLFAGFVYNRLKVTQKQKVIIEQKERETHAQKEIIEEKHKEITDSINYAERIQRSFLATQEMLDKYLGVTSSSPKNEGVSRSERGYFVFFRPKDVVSGDFYWAAELNNGNFAFTCADSTGHGVPGAIMSILNISSLEKSVEKDTEPHQILNTTRRIIIDRLKKDGSPEGGKDGMDCSLFVLNKDKSQLSFASANNPVFILRAVASSSPEENTSHPVTSSSSKNEDVSRSNKAYEILEYKPDKMPVGKHDKENEPFTLHTLQLQKGDVIYTLTDGYADQFGGDKGKKYMIKNLKELLLSIAHLPMPEQEQKLAEEFAAWKGKNEQVDDVCVIGVRI